jgi:hypothetical protein
MATGASISGRLEGVEAPVWHSRRTSSPGADIEQCLRNSISSKTGRRCIVVGGGGKMGWEGGKKNEEVQIQIGRNSTYATMVSRRNKLSSETRILPVATSVSLELARERIRQITKAVQDVKLQLHETRTSCSRW